MRIVNLELIILFMIICMVSALLIKYLNCKIVIYFLRYLLFNAQENISHILNATQQAYYLPRITSNRSNWCAVYTEIGSLLTYLPAVDIWPLIKTSTPAPPRTHTSVATVTTTTGTTTTCKRQVQTARQNIAWRLVQHFHMSTHAKIVQQEWGGVAAGGVNWLRWQRVKCDQVEANGCQCQ